MSSCLSGQYKGTTTCQNCATGCKTCFAAGTTSCTSCNGTLYLAFDSTRCVDPCPAGQTTGADNNCLLCDRSCLACNNTIFNCTTCSTGFMWNSTGPGPCVSVCLISQYYNSTSGGCKDCPNTCRTCFGEGTDATTTFPNQCTSCTGTSYLAVGSTQCMTNCPSG